MTDVLRESIPTINIQPAYAEFLDKYCDPEQPVIIKGLAKNWPATLQWNAEKLRADLLANQHVIDRGVYFLSRQPVLQEYFEMPEFLEQILDSDQIMQDSIAWRFWINSKHNRTEFHYDTNAENVITVQLKGRKEWILVSPDILLPSYPFTNFTMIKDEEKLLRNKKYYKFDLEEGDLLYIPAFWYHRAVAMEEENININWTFTKRETSVLTRTFIRDIERLDLLHAVKYSKFSLLRNFYKTLIGLLPNVGGIDWGLKAFIESPYKPNKMALFKRYLKELLQIPSTIMSIPSLLSHLKRVDKTY